MAVHICSNCGHVEHIFGAEGGQNMAAQYGTELLASLPLAMSIRAQADAGTPSVAAEPAGEVAALYKALARKVASKLAAQGKDYSSKFPTISISKNS
jgi:ATP-binding protein involved in chromosome partitioning